MIGSLGRLTCPHGPATVAQMSLFSILRSLVTLGKGTIGGLSERSAGRDPIALFEKWLSAAERAGVFLPEAIALATSTPDGEPSVRMMLLKALDETGFVFYTNHASRKGAELAANERAAFLVYWNVLQRQIRVEGTVRRLSEEESDSYFKTRPRGSRIGAWASAQSSPLEDREELERRFRERDREFAGDDVPLPPFWGGYRLEPDAIEFWQGRANRLHDRLRFQRSGTEWTLTRLYP